LSIVSSPRFAAGHTGLDESSLNARRRVKFCRATDAVLAWPSALARVAGIVAPSLPSLVKPQTCSIGVLRHRAHERARRAGLTWFAPWRRESCAALTIP
jgi:hypothetical protein